MTDPLLVNAAQYGGAGNDRLTAALEAQSNGPLDVRNALTGGDGHDTVGAEVILGSYGGEARNTVWGVAGNDAIVASALAVEEGSAANAIYAGTAATPSSLRPTTPDTTEQGQPTRSGAAAATMPSPRRRTAGMESPPSPAATTYVVDRVVAFDPSRERLAFFGIADEGPPGLLDDLAAIVSVDSRGPGTNIELGLPDGYVSIRFQGLGANGMLTFADLVDDPASQLVLGTPDLLV